MSSDELTDEGKRRRESNYATDIQSFKKSKKLMRTPTKKEERDKDDKIMEILQQLAVDVKDIKREQKIYTEELKKLREENEKLRNENITIRMENEQTKKEMKELGDRIEWLEKEKKKDNVVVSGIKMISQDPEVIKKDMQKVLSEALNLDVGIKNAQKLGEKTCLLQLENAKEKDKLMRNKRKLKDYKEEFFINHDLTRNEKKIQEEITKTVKKARDEGKEVIRGFRKLTIAGNVWKWNKEEGKLKQLTT